MSWYTYTMKEDDPKELVKAEEIQVHVPERLRPGLYANVSNVNASDNEVTVNFIFVQPSDNPKGTLVSRVVLTADHAMGLAKSLEAAVTTQREISGK